MGSLYKECPFKKRSCDISCALFTKDGLDGCTFLEIKKSLDYISNDLFYVKDCLKVALTKKNGGNDNE